METEQEASGCCAKKEQMIRLFFLFHSFDRTQAPHQNVRCERKVHGCTVAVQQQQQVSVLHTALAMQLK